MLCVFDVNETLLDLAALDEFFDGVTGDPAARRDWFDLMIHNALTLTAAGGYRPFGQIAAACLPPIAAARGRTATPEHQRELGERLRTLPAHPEVGDAITRLRAAGFGVVALTNSVSEVAEAQLRNAGLRPLFDAVYSADEAGRLKPAPEPYRLVLRTEQVAPADAVLIAAHGWDITGAAAAGLGTAFVSRDQRFPLPAADAPGLTAVDIDDVATQLIGR
ncbi:haloacid dehalogenase type II [Amycolatopsis sp. 195334CR]|uniref:haloacid dehalogenase type II n=1 Tax=Amycolatopsis sp. 195334CR TaxID=2814588 RepID=UPI001A8E0D1F|nr:haloacid dehalogenase type II [Amycolatopsis sp. 195334CR]